MLIVGTKLDLVQENPEMRQVSQEEGHQYASDLNAQFLETSARKNLAICTAFDAVIVPVFGSSRAGSEVSAASVAEGTAAAREADGNRFACCPIQ